MCTGTGGYWMGCQWFVTLSFCLLRCILWRLSGCSSRSSLTTTLPRQPSEQSHSKFLVERRLSFQSPSHRTQEPLPTRIHEHQVGYQFSAEGEGLPSVFGFSDDFDAFFPGEHDSKTFSDQGVIVCYQDACHLRHNRSFTIPHSLTSPYRLSGQTVSLPPLLYLLQACCGLPGDRPAVPLSHACWRDPDARRAHPRR